MRPGDVLDDRFEIEVRAGGGGMGEVWRGRDRHTGERVAVKVLRPENVGGASRFARETDLLAQVRHPGVVRYIAHGAAPSGAPYLAMEWLDGEELGARLERGPLGLHEAVALAARVAEALGAMHARGIVHRDLKPSNVFLIGGDAGRVKLLDLGISRLAAATRLTQTGAILGTPAYMAPEQARGGHVIDPRADVFALGCVLYECITGEQAFSGEHVLAVLTKVLLSEVPSLRAACPEAPEALDALCARMLAKAPEDRPPDGAAVAAELAAIAAGALPGAAAPAPSRPRGAALTRAERRLLSLVLVGRDAAPGAVVASDAPTFVAEAPEELRQTIAGRGGRLDVLADGSFLIALQGTGLANDLAAQAARCALAARAYAGERRIALVTGRSEATGRLPGGELVDLATRMLAAPAAGAHGIAIDEVTAGLLDARFEVVEAGSALWLAREHAVAEGARTLLGKPTACVGRDWELSTLEGLLAGCVEESQARAALVTAPAGYGKSRLLYELLRRVRQRGAPLEIWIGRGDPLRAGAALGLLGQALGAACGLQEGEPIDARRRCLLARMEALVGAGEARRVAEFLGEIVGAPFPEDESASLRAARRDAQRMADQMRRAWVDLLEAVTAERPVLLVLEDLHWADRPTLQFVDEALRRLHDRPWLALALARPDVHDVHPALWAERQPQEIRLKPLSPRAGARLVRQVLGAEVGDGTVERLVAQADGNALYLEELIRAASEGRGEALPGSVLAMVQSRIEDLEEPARRALRAAAIVGKVFWRGAVEALLGGPDAAPGLGDVLERLERAEWITTRPEARFEGERELVFRHAIVHDAAYAMLPERDRALGHRLAGAWLERAGEPHAAVIAEHYERGSEPARAAAFYHRAAARALAASDLTAALSWTGRALDLGAEGDARGELLRIRAEADFWRGRLSEAASWARGALLALPRGGPSWYAAARIAGIASGRLGRDAELAELAAELAATWTGDATAPLLEAAAWMALYLLIAGRYPEAAALQARLDAAAASLADDPAVRGAALRERGFRAAYARLLGESRDLMERALRAHEQAGDLRNAHFDRINLGLLEVHLGAYDAAVALIRAAIAGAERMGLDDCLATGLSVLGAPLARLGALDEARACEQRAIALCAAQGDPRLEGTSRAYLAWTHWRAGDLAEAEAEARRAVQLLAAVKPLEPLGRATLAGALLARGRAADALAEASEAMALLTALGMVEEGEAMARLVHAESLAAVGDRAAARAALTEARDRLLAAASRIDEPARRERFLRDVDENARTLTLAREWLDDAAS